MVPSGCTYSCGRMWINKCQAVKYYYHHQILEALMNHYESLMFRTISKCALQVSASYQNSECNLNIVLSNISEQV